MKKFLLGIVLYGVFFASVFAADFRIVIDAGSTGSRLHIFQYTANKNSVPEIKDIFSESIKPGLSSFKNSPEKAGASLKPLIEHAMMQLRTKGYVDLKKVKIDVLATAGMRLLEPSVQLAIYQNVIAMLKDKFVAIRVETIAGGEEALYGWLDINYLAKNFQNHTPTMGSIDMGGASTQIAFATDDVAHPDDIVPVTLGNVTYRVFAKSFLGLGEDQARDKINLRSNAGSCYPAGFSLALLPGFDFTACSILFSDVIKEQNVVEQLPSLDNITFYAFSGAYYTYKFFDADRNPEQSYLHERIAKVCTQSWEQLSKAYPQEKYLASYCANAVYMDALFYNAYGIYKGKLSVLNKVNGGDIDWTLGSVLYALSLD